MHIFIKTLAGKVIPLEVEPYDTFGDIKEIFQDLEGIPAQSQRYLFEGKICLNEFTLESYGFVDGSMIYSILFLRGGLTERKKNS